MILHDAFLSPSLDIPARCFKTCPMNWCPTYVQNPDTYGTNKTSLDRYILKTKQNSRKIYWLIFYRGRTFQFKSDNKFKHYNVILCTILQQLTIIKLLIMFIQFGAPNLCSVRKIHISQFSKAVLFFHVFFCECMFPMELTNSRWWHSSLYVIFQHIKTVHRIA